MSDLTKTLDDLSKVELADEIVKRDAEIERLNCALIISRGKHENAIREIERLRERDTEFQRRFKAMSEHNAKLQAVVDAVTGGIPSEITEALAALEEDSC